MSAEFYAIVAVGVSLAALIFRLEAAVRDLGERVARLEGAMPFLARRRQPGELAG